MSNDWASCSEVVAGLIYNNRISPNVARADLFIPPYDQLIKEIQKGECSKEDLVEKIGLAPIHTANEAAKSLNGLGELDWLTMLENSAIRYDAGVKLERLTKKLKQGEDIDWSQITYYAEKAQEGVGTDFTPLSQVKRGSIPFIETGWKPIDEHLAGIPKIGLVVVGGPPKVGKTSFIAKLFAKFAQTHPDKQLAFFSLEMMLEELSTRFDEVEKLDQEIQDRILLNDHPANIQYCISKAAGIDNLGLVGIDFADLLIEGETNSSSMEHIYRELARGTKKLGCPIVLLAQLSNYNGGLPKPSNLRWTRLAEALGWTVLMLYNPSSDWFGKEEAENTELPIQDGTAFILAWLMRGGFRNHLDDSPGAIQVAFSGKHGWGEKKSRWFSLKNEM